MNRRGFTLVELLTTMAVIGVLASIALPKYQHLKKRANAAEVVAAMGAIRAAAYQYNELAGTWPPTAGLGIVPAGLGPYLPGGGASIFRGTDHQLGWITISGGFGVRSTQIMYAAFTDGVICQSFHGLLGGARNSDLLALCGAGGGFVFVWIDR